MLKIPVLSNHFLTTRATELFLIFGLNRFLVTMTPMNFEKYSQNLKFRKCDRIRRTIQNLLIGSETNRAAKNVIGSEKNRSDRFDRIRSVFSEQIF